MQRNGFTLVELMMVIALMALFTSATVLAVSSAGTGTADTAAGFASRIAAARDEAILTGRPVSAWVTASGYGFDQISDGHWSPMADKPFESADWERGTNVAFGGSELGRARVRFDTVGMPDRPLVVRLSSGGRATEVRLDPTGDVSVN